MLDSKIKFKIVVCLFIVLFICVSSGYSSKITFKEKVDNGWLLKTEKMQVEISSIDKKIFRIKAVPLGSDWENKPSTFIDPDFQNKTKQYNIQKFEEKIKFGIKTGKGTINVLNNSCEIYLVKQNGNKIIKDMKLIFHSGPKPFWGVVFTCPSKERNYGVGNPEMGRSGGLLKSYAITTVGNGISQIPFFWSTAGYGILINYDKKGMIKRKKGHKHHLIIPGTKLDFYLLLGDTPYQILKKYTDLTGNPPIPPVWAFGFMISRWGYKGWKDVKDKWETFRKKKIPVDVFIYDYDWFKKDWEWNYNTFPDPEENMAMALKKGIRIVGIRKPRCDYYKNFNFIKEKNWILPGSSKDINLFIPEAGEWWWDKQVPLLKSGIAGWWNDEAETALLEYYYMVLTQWNGMQKIYPGRRVWTINRAFSPGLQRLGASVWTGDVESTWKALQNQPGTFLNYGMAGMPYSSSDIGGFQGRPSGELYTRWIQVGIFTPIMRVHGALNLPRWPWSFGIKVEKAVKKAIEMRYQLIPYLYSYARKSYLTGMPINRPLFFEFKDDPQTFNMEDEWLMGREILVAPVLNKGGQRDVYFPDARWYDLQTGKIVDGPAVLTVKAELDEIPVYIREGSILPFGPVMQHTEERENISLAVHIYTGRDGKFLLYLDDGETYNYKKEEYKETVFEWKEKSHTLIINKSKGNYKGPKKYFINKIIVYGVNKPEKIVQNNKIIKDFKYQKKNYSVEIKCSNLNLDKEYVLKINTTSKKKNVTDKKLSKQHRLEIAAVKGDQLELNKLIKMFPGKDSSEKIRILNVLALFLDNNKVYNIIKTNLRRSDLRIKISILRIIRGYCPGEKYADLVLPLAFDKNMEIASISREIINTCYQEEAVKYFGLPIKEWAIIGPFKNKKFREKYPPEQEINLNASYKGLSGNVKWRTALADNNGVINLLKSYPEISEYVCAYGMVNIKSKNKKDVELWMGSDDGIKAWLNGKKVWIYKAGRGLVKDQDKVKVRLKKGDNILLLKISQGTGDWMYTARLVDKNGGLNELSYINHISDTVVFKKEEKIYKGSQLKIESILVSSIQEKGAEAENLFDNNTGTRWSSEFKDNQWIVLDLGKKRKMDRIVLLWEAAHAETYTIEISANKKKWKEIYFTESSSGDEEIIDFNLVKTRYIKINLKKRATDWGFSLFEIKIFWVRH